MINLKISEMEYVSAGCSRGMLTGILLTAGTYILLKKLVNHCNEHYPEEECILQIPNVGNLSISKEKIRILSKIAPLKLDAP